MIINRSVQKREAIESLRSSTTKKFISDIIMEYQDNKNNFSIDTYKKEKITDIVQSSSILYYEYGIREVSDLVFDELNKIQHICYKDQKNPLDESIESKRVIYWDSDKFDSDYTNDKDSFNNLRCHTKHVPRHDNSILDTYSDWYKRSISKLKEKYDIEDFKVFIFPKFTGITCLFETDENRQIKRVTTSNSFIGGDVIDITEIFKSFKSSNSKYEFGGSFQRGIRPNSMNKCTMSLSDETINKYNQISDTRLHSSRELLVSAINYYLRRGEYGKYPCRITVTESVVSETEVPRIESGALSEQYFMSDASKEDHIKCLIDFYKREYGAECDGIIVAASDDDVRNTLGFDENGVPEYQIAIDCHENTYKVVVTDVKFEMGSSRTVVPVIKVASNELGKIKFREIMLRNGDVLNNLHIKKGDELIVHADNVPVIYKNLTYDMLTDDERKEHNEQEIECVIHCPICGSRLSFNIAYTTIEGKIKSKYKCINKICASEKISRMNNFLSRLNIFIPYIEFTTDLYFHNIASSIPDLFNIVNNPDSKKIILNRINVTEEALDYFIDSFNERTRSVSDVRFLYAINIPSIGLKRSKSIMDAFTSFDILVDYVDSYTVDQLKDLLGKKVYCSIHPDTIAKKLHKYTRDFIKLGTLVETYSQRTEFLYVFTKTDYPEFDSYLTSIGGMNFDSVVLTAEEEERYEGRIYVITPNDYSYGYKEKLAIEKCYNLLSIEDAKKYFELTY